MTDAGASGRSDDGERTLHRGTESHRARRLHDELLACGSRWSSNRRILLPSQRIEAGVRRTVLTGDSEGLCDVS